MKARSSESRRGFLRRLSALSIVSVGIILLAAGQPAYADALDSARSAGTIGEGPDGYTIARDASAEVLAASTNAKRKSFYEQKAREQGVSPAEIQAVYAQAIREKAQPGWWFLTQSGWQQK